MRCLIVASLAVGLVLPAVASAGSAANPALTVGRENFGFSFEIEKQKKDLDGDLATSTRWLGKAIWGVTDKLDLYARLGASDLTIPVAGGPDFHGKRGMTWGGGGRYMVAEVPKPAVKTYLDIQ